MRGPAAPTRGACVFQGGPGDAFPRESVPRQLSVTSPSLGKGRQGGWARSPACDTAKYPVPPDHRFRPGRL